MVKNELDILPFVLKELLKEEIDGFVIADNMSEDGTREFLAEFAAQNKNVTIKDDYKIAYYQSEKMNRLIDLAVDQGATHIIAADADEHWYSLDPHITVGAFLRAMPYDVAVATVYDMVPPIGGYENPLTDFKYRESNVKALPSVAFKWVPGAQVTMGNHDVYHSGNRTYDSLAIRHFQYRSLEQFKFKQRNGRLAYEATTFDFGVGTHWRLGGLLSDEEMQKQWEAILHQPNVVYDPVPIR